MELEAVREKLVADISRATEPGKMSQAEAVDFLEHLISDIECAIEAIKEDMNSDED